MGAQPRARIVHSRFAHQALRRAAFENPTRCVGLLQSPEAKSFLLELWAAVRDGAGLSAGGGPADELPESLNAEMTQVGPYSAAVVRMPPPQNPGEAYFIGLVLRSYARPDGAVISRDPLLLYYTLEQADAAGATRLCEWQGGDHVRFADPPLAELAAFRDAMWTKITELQDRENLAPQGQSL